MGLGFGSFGTDWETLVRVGSPSVGVPPDTPTGGLRFRRRLQECLSYGFPSSHHCLRAGRERIFQRRNHRRAPPGRAAASSRGSTSQRQGSSPRARSSRTAHSFASCLTGRWVQWTRTPCFPPDAQQSPLPALWQSTWPGSLASDPVATEETPAPDRSTGAIARQPLLALLVGNPQALPAEKACVHRPRAGSEQREREREGTDHQARPPIRWARERTQ